MNVAILDDWFDTLRTLECFGKLSGHDVTVFTDHVQDTDTLATLHVVGPRADGFRTPSAVASLLPGFRPTSTSCALPATRRSS